MAAVHRFGHTRPTLHRAIDRSIAGPKQGPLQSHIQFTTTPGVVQRLDRSTGRGRPCAAWADHAGVFEAGGRALGLVCRDHALSVAQQHDGGPARPHTMRCHAMGNEWRPAASRQQSHEMAITRDRVAGWTQFLFTLDFIHHQQQQASPRKGHPIKPPPLACAEAWIQTLPLPLDLHQRALLHPIHHAVSDRFVALRCVVVAGCGRGA